MSISLNAIAWEVDPANGSPSNGGGFLAGASGTDKSYGVGQLATTRNDLACHSIGAPSAPTVNASGTGGTVAAGTYSVVVTYTGGGGETLPSSASSVTVSSGQDIVVTSPATATGATAYKVYISAVGTTTPLYLQNTSAGTAIGTNYTLATAVNTTTANPPITDSSGILLTSTGNQFGSTDVGNVIQVTAGSGWTADFYCVAGVVGTTAILDRSPAAAGTTGGTGTLGGALASPLNLPAVPGSNKVFIKGNATCLMGSTWTISATAVDGYANPPTLVSGYGTTRGDAGRATLQATATGITLVNITGNGGEVQNLVLDCNNKSGTTGVSVAQFSSVRNCTAKNFGTYGIATGFNSLVYGCEATGGAVSSYGMHLNSAVGVIKCYVHDTAGVGIYCASAMTLLKSVVSNCSGATTDGVQCGANSFVWDNTIRNCGNYGLNAGGPQNYAFSWGNNVIVGNGAAGMVGSTQAGLSANSASDGNAFYNNGAGGTVSRLYMDDGTATSVHPINAVAPYTDSHDKTLTGDPFVNAAGGNFALNNLPGQGAAARAAEYPSSLVGLSTSVGYGDMGAFQHQDSGGGGGGIPKINSIFID